MSASSEITPYRTALKPADITPLGDRVLVRHLSHQEKIGAIFIPPVAQEKATYTHNQGYVFRGVVVAVGAGCDYIERLNKAATRWVKRRMPCVVPPSVKVGDVILFERRRESELILDGEMYTLCHDDQSILAVEGE